jgi:hypothetical protein
MKWEDWSTMKTIVRIVGLLFFLLFCSGIVVPQVERTIQKNGRLVVIVVSGDDYTRTDNVFIYAHGYLPDGYPGETSLALKETRAGWYEASLAPGLYDVLLVRARRFQDARGWRLRPTK